MKHEYTVKKGQHYFKGPKIQTAHIQITLCLLSSILGILINPWFLISTLLLYIVFQTVIYKQLRKVHYNAYFFNSCTYVLEENYDQINKLFGVSEIFHHWNSARIGWRCIDGENIELLAYCYVDKKRVYKKLITIMPEQKVSCSIEIDKNEYVFHVVTDSGQGSFCHIPKSNFKISNLFMYRLYPYFGGRISAPKFMKIKLEQQNK